MKVIKHLKSILIFVVFIAFIFCGGCNYSQAFKHKHWIEAEKAEDWAVRKNMAQYLIEKQFLIGKSKSYVLKNLGNPEDISDQPKDQLFYRVMTRTEVQ